MDINFFDAINLVGLKNTANAKFYNLKNEDISKEIRRNLFSFGNKRVKKIEFNKINIHIYLDY